MARARLVSGPHPLVVVVDDELPLQRYVSTSLRARGYEVRVASDGTEALKVLAESLSALVVLDVNMPGPDGFQVLEALRREIAVPVLMLSGRGREGDKVRALDLGADDYVTKPFGIEELLARIRAALRRAPTTRHEHHVPPYRYAGLEIDYDARRVRTGGRDVRLTPREYDLLAHLSRNAGRVLTHRQILESVWGPAYGEESEYIWAYVKRVRRKIEPDPAHPRLILTEKGVGYRMPEAAEGPGERPAVPFPKEASLSAAS